MIFLYKNILMDSNLTKILKNKSKKILNYTQKFKISTQNIIVYSVLLNAFAILNLLNREIYVFVLLFITAFYLQIVAKVNKQLTNDTTRLVRFFGRFSIWLMLSTTLYAVYNTYFNYLNASILIIFIIISILCNINYSLKILTKIEHSELEEREDVNTYIIKKWASMFNFIDKDKRLHFKSITKYFDETMMIIYFVIAIIYLEHRRATVSFINL
jgi:hypothetical protein